MSGLDRAVWDAKSAATKALMDLVRDGKTCGDDIHNMANALDNLNKAWDSLTDRLVAQREERGREVLDLLNRLAEVRSDLEKRQ
jgi:hypothetical protein